MSRDYGIIVPRFWTAGTGKNLRGDKDAQILAAYLMTSPHATATGVYHCPMVYVVHETGLTIEGASKALRRLIGEAFCEYDDTSETVFVINMATHQVAAELDPKDKRIPWLRKELAKMPTSLKQRFLQVHGAAFHLIDTKPLGRGIEDPPKPGSGSGSGSGSTTAPSSPARVPRETFPDWLLDFKLVYPARAGDQGWRKAVKAANARIAEGHTPEEFIEGAKRYGAHCATLGKVGTEFVKQAATFLGPDKPFLEPWTTPAKVNGNGKDPYRGAI